MNILVTGANGQLGNELKKRTALLPNANFLFTDVDELDITKEVDVDDFFKKNQIDFVVNCAAYTAVDKAETEQNLALTVNYQAVANLVNVCSKHNCFLIHMSTDYVFNGHSYKPYREIDIMEPVSFYGISKWRGEQIAKTAEKGIIIRTSWLYSNFGHNFVFTMQKLGRSHEALNVVYDQVGTPTFAGHLAEAIWAIIPQLTDWKEGVQIYHYSNEGVCSWYDFAKEIMQQCNFKCQAFPIESKDYPTPATRPFYSVLNKSKIKQRFGLSIPHWKDGLLEMLRNQDSITNS
ncbi:MAG: dTDP-4-dehydrorhamnose reductase [Bacteroidales bacterium]|jgi:dTDP-4-dehydrorhamnose reductase|nr:dTDP-4-dehydrorhamnose reductase [Bacteroidales bacterium]